MTFWIKMRIAPKPGCLGSVDVPLPRPIVGEPLYSLYEITTSALTASFRQAIPKAANAHKNARDCAIVESSLAFPCSLFVLMAKICASRLKHASVNEGGLLQRNTAAIKEILLSSYVGHRFCARLRRPADD